MFRKISIQSKIVLPYTLLFAAVIVIISLITIGIIYRRIDERIERQMEKMAEAISNMGFILSDDFLNSIRINQVIGAEIITYKHDGTVISTTLKRDNLKEVIEAIDVQDIEETFLQENSKSLIRNINYLNHPYKVIYRLMGNSEDGDSIIFSLMASTADIAMTKRRSAITIVLIAVSGIFLVAIIGGIIASNITAPVKQLVNVTQKIATGDLSAEALVNTRDEIGILANSFNQMTRELKISRDKLIQSEKLAAVGQIAAGVAHEIRNPLTSMKMIVQLLKRRSQDDENSKKQIQVVLDEINRLEIIINGLLDFARPMQLSLKPVNVADIIDDVLNIMIADLSHRKIELEKNIEENLRKVMLDADRMKQVFMNLILNSMQAMPDGGKLIIKCYNDENNKKVLVEIRDTGLGMSKETLNNAFEPFFSTKAGGIGLGLSNVKKIIEQHGGSIHLESKEGEGSSVITELLI